MLILTYIWRNIPPLYARESGFTCAGGLWVPFAAFMSRRSPDAICRLEVTDWDWQIDPSSLRIFLNEIADRYENMQMMVVRNGMGAFDEVVIEDDLARAHHVIANLPLLFERVALRQVQAEIRTEAGHLLGPAEFGHLYFVNILALSSRL